jgi:hypothetical protein
MNQRGQALIDSAIAIVVLLAVILAVVDVAQIVYTQQALSERVRLAARKAALESLNDDAIIREVVGRGWNQLRPEHVRVRRIAAKGGAQSVRVSIVGYRYTLVSAFGGGSLQAREISHTEPVDGLPANLRHVSQ